MFLSLSGSRLFHVFIYNILFPHRKTKKKYTSSYFGVLYHSERKTKIVFNIFVQFSGLFLLFSKFTQLFNKFRIMQAGGLKQLLWNLLNQWHFSLHLNGSALKLWA